MYINFLFPFENLNSPDGEKKKNDVSIADVLVLWQATPLYSKNNTPAHLLNYVLWIGSQLQAPEMEQKAWI